MKLILSRKGCDTSTRTGKKASPIFPNGTMVSFPIPASLSDGAAVTYGDIAYKLDDQSHPLGELLKQLKVPVELSNPTHLDPDIVIHNRPTRKEGWRPLFGQSHSAESHLQNQNVGKGDLFLFFGMFQQVDGTNGRWRYQRGSRPIHSIFGWLQVEERVLVSDWPLDHAWALDHPHLQRGFKENRNHFPNVVYMATEKLSLPGVDSLHMPGAGTFRYSSKLRLTKRDYDGLSKWLLPSWFSPKNRQSCLSRCENPNLWSDHPDGIELNSGGYGQEFVLNCEHYPEAIGWMQTLFASAGSA